MRVFHWLLAAIAGATVTVLGATAWATRVYFNIEDLMNKAATAERQTNERIASWTAWRIEVDAHFRAIDSRTGDRWTRASMRDYSAQLGYMNPSLKAPDVDIIANRQTAP